MHLKKKFIQQYPTVNIMEIKIIWVKTNSKECRELLDDFGFYRVDCRCATPNYNNDNEPCIYVDTLNNKYICTDAKFINTAKSLAEEKDISTSFIYINNVSELETELIKNMPI